MSLSRRKFTTLSLAALSTPVFAPAVLGQAKPRVVVIGGGPGGGTVARYVAKDSNGAIDVMLVGPQRNFTTCFFSNLYVGGFRDFKSITHNYDKVAQGRDHVAHVNAVSGDREQKRGVLPVRQKCLRRLVIGPGSPEFTRCPYRRWGQHADA